MWYVHSVAVDNGGSWPAPTVCIYKFLLAGDERSVAPERSTILRQTVQRRTNFVTFAIVIFVLALGLLFLLTTPPGLYVNIPLATLIEQRARRRLTRSVHRV